MLVKDVMLDLETMGNGPNAAIVAVGAVGFDIEHRELHKNEFYMPIHLESSVRYGGAMDASTVLWWLKQSDDARSLFQSTDKNNELHHVLGFFRTWLEQFGNIKDIRVWGNGSDFDNVILSSAYKAVGREVPWKFWNNRCYRTLKELLPDIKINREGTHHNALDDARSQSKHLLDIMAAISLSNHPI